MKTTELSNTPTSVEKQDNLPYGNLEFTNIDGTPFTIVKQDEKYYGLIGNHRITEEWNNLEELKEDLLKVSWDRITQVIWAVVEKFKFNEEEIKKLLENG